MNITDCRTAYQENPIGIDLDGLTFSWKCEEAEGTQTKDFHILVAEDPSMEKIIYDSGRDTKKKGSSSIPSAFTPDASFLPGRRYYWTVKVKDDLGDLDVSDVHTFEGGHPLGPWKGRWISPSFTREIHPVLRKTFTLTREELSGLQAGRLYICGLGLYEAYLNGRKLGDAYLAPYFTDYRYWTQYQTYDLSGYLREGENILDVYLGNGWYKGRFGYLANGQLREYYGDRFALLADLYLYGADSVRIIPTDETWQALKSPVVSSGIYDGEVLDLRKCAALRHPSKRDISPVITIAPPVQNLSPMLGVPVRAHEKRKPAAVLHTPMGETVLDFGQEITGWVEVDADLPADAHLILEYGEVLQGGNFYRDNLRTADAAFTCIFAGDGPHHVRPHFTYYGFRYVKVTGMDVTEETKNAFTGVSIYSDLKETGFIETGAQKVNRLIQNTKWSEKDNFVDIPTDCPQRDERLGWTGDAEIFADTASFHMETARFFEKYLKDMNYEQREKDGAVPYVVPDVLTVGREKLAEPPFPPQEDQWGEAGAAVWGDAATIIPWVSWLHYGDRALLAREYPNMTRWVDFMRYMDEEYCGGKRLWTCGFHFGDWLSLDAGGDTAGMDHREGGTNKHFVASVYYMYSASLTAKAAAILGKTDDAKEYQNLSDEVRAAVRSTYVTGEGTLAIDTQTAYVLGIHFGLFDTKEGMKRAGDHLAELIEKWNGHLSTGFVGTAYLCDALTQTGHNKEAVSLLLNEEYPGWLYEVNLGATTIWERWNSLLPDGSISGTGMNSLNHYAYGSVCGWIYERICGLTIPEEGAGGTKLIIAPHPDERLGHASASVLFPNGKYESAWSYQDDGKTILYRFTVPFDGTAQFVPDPSIHAEAYILDGTSVRKEVLQKTVFCKGTYEIEVPLQ